jgi:hypothetical protein
MMTPDSPSLMMYSSPSSLPLGERSVYIQNTIYTESMREKAVKQALNECEKRIIIEQANRDERRDRSLMPLESTGPDRKSAI